ncbi:MAG: DUF2550 domain-containing protein [Propionibacteriaceae bacterium]|jgi:hypothetical protein|nr:DUF2550 domain-containing protein [Propionibacteriaceae bacterium]
MIGWLVAYLPGLLLALVGICVCLTIGLIIRRRLLCAGGGVFDCGMRRYTAQRSFPWSSGMARYLGDEFLWYRAFSLSSKPVLRLSRRMMRLESQHQPQGAEALELPFGDFVVTISVASERRYDFSMAAGSALGMTTWLEAGSRSDIAAIDLAWC